MKHRIEPIWRPAYEIYAFYAWLGVAALMYWLVQTGGAIATYLWVLLASALALAFLRGGQALALWERKAQLTQSRDLRMSGKQILKKVKWAQKKAKRGKLRIEP